MNGGMAGMVNQATGITPFDLVKVADCGDAFLEAPYELMGAHKEIEDFFANLPKLEKKIEMKCSRCGFEHKLDVEGLESFFG
jgi:hypothetical protein